MERSTWLEAVLDGLDQITNEDGPLEEDEVVVFQLDNALVIVRMDGEELEIEVIDDEDPVRLEGVVFDGFEPE